MKIASLYKVLRTNDWWNNIIPPILGFFALGQLGLDSNFRILYVLGIVFLLMILIAIFGFFIGEWSDIEDDIKAGKTNPLVGKSTFFKVGFTAIIISGVTFFTFYLNLLIPGLYLILLAQIVCFILYSIPPFRLKKSKIASLMLDSLYSGTLMYIFVFAISNASTYRVFGLIFIWGLLRGQRNYILHTLNDAENDKKIGVKSIGNSYGKEKIISTQKYFLFPLEVVTMIAFLWQIASPYNYILMTSYALIVVYSFYHQSEEEKMNSYGFLSSINLFHEMLMPLLAFIILSVLNIFWLIPLFLLLILFNQYKEWSRAIVFKLKSFL